MWFNGDDELSNSNNKDYSPVVYKLEEAIDLVDKIESFINRIDPHSGKVSAGVIFQIYQNLVLLREKIVEARMEAVKRCS